MTEHFLESDVAILKEKLRLSQEIVGNLSDQLARAQEVILASLPMIKWYKVYGSSYLSPKPGVDLRFIENNGYLNEEAIYKEAKEVLGFYEDCR